MHLNHGEDEKHTSYRYTRRRYTRRRFEIASPIVEIFLNLCNPNRHLQRACHFALTYSLKSIVATTTARLVIMSLSPLYVDTPLKMSVTPHAMPY